METGMRAKRFLHSDTGFISTFVKLAQSTFYDALPSNAQGKGPTASATLPGALRDPPEARTPRKWMSILDDWLYRQQLKDREAWLAQATNVFELENRIRELERRPWLRHY